MPRLNENLDKFTLGGYQFSGEKMENLGAANYCLASLLCDASGSLTDFADDLNRMHQEIVKSTMMSPAADFLMLRAVSFNDKEHEHHGFKLLSNCNLADYDNLIDPDGNTLLIDSMYNAVSSTVEYAEQMKSQMNYSRDAISGIIYVITDGVDNRSRRSASAVKDLLAKVKREEKMDFLLTILIGVNTTNPSVLSYLERLRDEAGFDRFVDVGEATPQKLAKLAGFVSKSYVSSSKKTGTGSAPDPDSFTF